ncbi:MAG TPA: hypothetical protein VIJ14_09850 [Rhabdochlamydiaceae bacterium]
MTVQTDFKLIKEKNLDENTVLKVSKNIMSGRIFVEFSSENPRIVLQKNFQDSIDGKKEADIFSKSIKSTNQLKSYFGLDKDRK